MSLHSVIHCSKTRSVGGDAPTRRAGSEGLPASRRGLPGVLQGPPCGPSEMTGVHDGRSAQRTLRNRELEAVEGGFGGDGPARPPLRSSGQVSGQRRRGIRERAERELAEVPFPHIARTTEVNPRWIRARPTEP